MQKAEKRLTAILKRAVNAGISYEAISIVLSKEASKFTAEESKEKTNVQQVGRYWPRFVKIFLLIAGISLAAGRSYFSRWLQDPYSECLIAMPFDETKVFRPPEDCGMCRGVEQVDRITNVSEEDFDEMYASRARPVIITDGTRGWSAPERFSFNFFKELYAQSGRSTCQFFPYRTEFSTLQEVFNMSAARARLEQGSAAWYVGWSNCDDAAGQELRRHYQRPYFLPDTSENMGLSWIFMGGPGEGAHMHVDNVRYASWQAQIRGRKKWRLAPPPECYYTCEEFSVVVEPGEIIVVDTNRWYHQTHILPGDISITIGTEFD